MNEFDRIILASQGDVRSIPWTGNARLLYAQKYSKEMRLDGFTVDEVIQELKGPRSKSFSPPLTDGEIQEVTTWIFNEELKFTQIQRKKRTLELFRKLTKQGYKDEEIFKRLKLLNTRCCIPPLSDEEINWIIKNNACEVVNIPYWVGRG